MSYSKETYQKALAIVQQRRTAAEHTAEQKKLAFYAAHPELEQLDQSIHQHAVRIAKYSMQFQSSAAAKEKAEFDELTKEREQMLALHNITDFSPVFRCQACSDSGFVDGLLCECVLAEARNIEYAMLGKTMPLKESTFDQFDLKYYKSTSTPQGNPREVMTSIFQKCKQYAETFSPERSGNQLFLGETGLGKTHLSLGIAGVAIEKGYGVVYASAQNLLNQIEKEHFGRSSGEFTAHVCECDLLILDDLGAEFSTQFSQSSLYNIINTRMQAHRPTIISTNLNAEELQERYGQRIMSRIIGNFDAYRFIGNDIRQIKRVEKIKK